jgi:hypothetical protein
MSVEFKISGILLELGKIIARTLSGEKLGFIDQEKGWTGGELAIDYVTDRTLFASRWNEYPASRVMPIGA